MICYPPQLKEPLDGFRKKDRMHEERTGKSILDYSSLYPGKVPSLKNVTLEVGKK